VLKKTRNKSIEDISKRKLSIQFSLDGFSFCISNSKGEIYHLTSYSFEEKVNSPEFILERLQEVFKTDKTLQDEFDTVHVIHQNSLNTLVPNQYFKEDDLKSYLKYAIRTISTDFIVFDDLDQLNAKNVYIPYVNINNFLFQNFGEFEYSHHSTLLIEKLISKSNEGHYFYVHVSPSAFEIIVIENKQLILYNSFEYTTKEDFIYYVLFALEQLKIDPETSTITLLGDIDKDSNLYDIAYHYIQHVEFLKMDSPILDNQTEFHKHSNFTLLG
jgi:hypothetical protein